MAHRVKVNKAVSYSILSKLWSFIAGPINAMLIAVIFTPEIQGFYYTFGSLLALQTFAELGLGRAITQFASHEWANLSIGKDKKIVGDRISLSKLASISRIALKWYFISAVILTVGLSVGGYVFFSQSSAYDINWRLPWIFLCFFTGINLFTVSIWSILEGCNQVSNVYYFRFFRGLVVSISTWTAILLYANLWTASIMTVAGLIYSVFFLSRNYLEFFKSLLHVKIDEHRFRWINDILPFQWRIALSWISGYFIFNLFTPVLFLYHGPVLAGQMGMTWTLIGASMSIALSWIGPRTPQMAILIAKKKFEELDALFLSLVKIVAIIATVLSVLIWLFIYLLYYLDFSIAYRLLPPIPAGLFLLGQLIITIVSPCSNYLRAHKKEPLLFLSVLNGLLTGISTLIVGKYFSVIEIAGAFFIINLFIQPLVLLTWHRFKLKHHRL